MAKRFSYYDILGVKQDASFDEIKSARNELIKHLHPDITTSKVAEELVKYINEAYSTLSNAVKRREYDVLLDDTGSEENEGYVKIKSADTIDILIGLLKELNEKEDRLNKVEKQKIRLLKESMPKSEYRVGSNIYVERSAIHKSKVDSGISTTSYQSIKGTNRVYWQAAFIFLAVLGLVLLASIIKSFNFVSLFLLLVVVLIGYFVVLPHMKRVNK